MRNIGNKLKTIRLERNMSQQRFADSLNMSNSAYSRLENDETDVTLERLVSLAKILEVPIQDFLSEGIHLDSSGEHAQIMTFGDTHIHYNVHSSNKDHVIEQKDEEISRLKKEIEEMKKRS